MNSESSSIKAWLNFHKSKLNITSLGTLWFILMIVVGRSRLKMGKTHFTNDIKKLAALVTFLQAFWVPLLESDLKKGSHFDEFFVEKCKHFGIQKKECFFCALYIYESTTVSPPMRNWRWTGRWERRHTEANADGRAPHRHICYYYYPPTVFQSTGKPSFLATSLFKAHMPVCRHFPHPRLRRQRKILKMQTLN